MSSSDRIKVGVLGATGYIGKPYREEMRAVDDCEIVALCGRRESLLQQAAREDGAELITTDWREVVCRPDVDLVVVATPDALHHQAVMECARQRKHVLCEKPVGKNAREAAEMWHAYRDSKLAHFVPFWTRYAAIFQKAKEIVDSGRLGAIRGLVYRWHNPRPANMPITWRDDANLSAGGSIADVGSHAYDTMCWLTGQRAVKVVAHADTISPPKADLGPINLDEALMSEIDGHDSGRKRGTTPDYASIAWQSDRGAVGTLVLSHATYFRKGLAPELELHGTDASLAIDRFHGNLILADGQQAPAKIESIPDVGFGNRFEKHVFPVVRAAINATKGRPDANPSEPGSGAHPDLQDGWHVQRFTDAALESATTGKAIALSDDGQ